MEQNIEKMGGKELTTLHNEHAADAGCQPIKKWGGKLTDLRTRTQRVVAAAEKVRAERIPVKPVELSGDQSADASRSASGGAPSDQKLPKARGIGAFVTAQLHAGIVDTNVLLAQVVERFPGAKTTGACIRWYAAKEKVSLRTARVTPTAAQ